MTPIEDEIARQRAILLRVETNGASEIVRSYKTVRARLAAQLGELTNVVEAARAIGVEPKASWLFQQERYRELVAAMDRETLAFLHRALRATITTKTSAVDAALRAAPELTLARLGPAPALAEAAVRGSFIALPDAQLERFVSFAGETEPLGQLFARVAGAAAGSLKDALAYGIASGKSPRVIAAMAQQASGTTLTRALTISRTETLRAYRTTSSTMYGRSNVVESWTWYAELDDLTCPICWDAHGTIHPSSEDLDTHPNCRCTQVPNTKSWSDLGFHGIPETPSSAPIPTGHELFAKLPASSQARVLGPTRFAAYKRGDVGLSDLVRRTSTPYGPGRRVASLHEAAIPLAH